MLSLVKRIQALIVSILPVLVIACLPAATACSAYPHHAQFNVRIDPAFTAEQRQAIYGAVDAWDEAATLSVSVSDWGDSNAVPIMRVDSLVSEGKLGKTHFETVERKNDRIMIAGAGVLTNGMNVDAFDFETTAAHELGHLLMGGGAYDQGCDGQGHSNNVAALMYAHGTPDGKRHEIADEDVERVLAVVDRAW